MGGCLLYLVYGVGYEFVVVVVVYGNVVDLVYLVV